MAAVSCEISQHSHELGASRVHPVFLLDEAHLLHQDVLDHLHILANDDWDGKAPLSIVLVGLPDLADRLAIKALRHAVARKVRIVDRPIEGRVLGDHLNDLIAGPSRRGRDKKARRPAP